MNGKRHLWNNGYMEWAPICSLIEKDLDLGELRFFPKLTMVHADPNPWEKMKVNAAAQTLSRTVGLALKSDGQERLSEFVLLFDKWFDLMNTSKYHAQQKGKAVMAPFPSNDIESEERLQWLENTSIGYLEAWKRRVDERYIPLTSGGAIDRPLMRLSKSTEHGLILTTKSMVALVRLVLQSGPSYVATRRLNQDPVESHFGHQRQRGRYCDAPTALTFGHNVRSINCFRSSVPQPVESSNITADP